MAQITKDDAQKIRNQSTFNSKLEEAFREIRVASLQNKSTCRIRDLTQDVIDQLQNKLDFTVTQVPGYEDAIVRPDGYQQTIWEISWQ
jgi:hypothetical protein